ncbi:sorbosone dehydrogenase family protein [bacterium]|nr:sorbosone dehydrogenase family protein [bacterium]
MQFQNLLAVVATLTLLSIEPAKSAPDHPKSAPAQPKPALAQPNQDPLTSFIKVPPGFVVSVYAKGLECPRQMALSPNGTLFVGTKINRNGKVYAIADKNKDGIGDQIVTIADNLKCPNGVAFHNGALYVAEINRILRYDNIESKLSQLSKLDTSTRLAPPTVVNSAFPSEGHHGWKYIRFGPDEKLYVPVGAPCNVCEPEKKIFATIMRMNKDGSNLELFASGIRNTVGFDFHPQTRQLWFTDNGRDMLGDDLPPDELNCATKVGLNFGFPYRYGANLPDPIFGNKVTTNKNFTPPAMLLGPHVAALGMRFYNGKQFPPQYQGNIFIAEHGSWNRSRKTGCRVSRIVLDSKANDTKDKSKGAKSGTDYSSREKFSRARYETFAEGWLNQAKQEYAGRPVDILVTHDGALLVSDDTAGVIYRISYKSQPPRTKDL